jgi:hypothetical protein
LKTPGIDLQFFGELVSHPLFQSGTPITLSLVMFNPFAFKKIGGILKATALIFWPGLRA